MIHFQSVDLQTFLKDYWQKKPLLIRQAIPDFSNPLTPDELAGLALEEEIESRMVLEKPDENQRWQLKRGPFTEKDFAKLPEDHWTLLVQGVDKVIPEVSQLLDHFDFIPQWRVDDVMISFATLQGSVGPHYDNYDVFLYQAKGRRKWSLTTQNCHEANALENTELRIMKEFEIEETLILEEGDMLYLPPHVGHYGISLSPECMTYSFGYRSYQGQELWDTLGDYVSEHQPFQTLYKDPDWSELTATSVLTAPSLQNAKNLLLSQLDNQDVMENWFGCFATRLDLASENGLPEPLEEEDLDDFKSELLHSKILERNPCCRFAYWDSSPLRLYVNGVVWDTTGVHPELVKYVANHRRLEMLAINPWIENEASLNFLYQLWVLQWISFVEA